MAAMLSRPQCVNWDISFEAKTNGRPFADGIFKFIFLYEKCCISIQISSKFVPNGSNYKHTRLGSDNGLASIRRQAIVFDQLWSGHYHVYASFGIDELT